MAKNNGTYYLIKEDLLDGSIEYFNFEEMDFSLEKGKGVSLPTIDAMTSLFSNGQELCNYLGKKDTLERDYPFRFYIAYMPLKKENERHLDAVFDDVTLNAISKITDGKIDYSHGNVYDKFIEMITAIKDARTGLAMRLTHSKKDSTRLSDYNKSIVGVLASSSSTHKEPSLPELMETFSTYKEFRALYLAFKENNANTYTLASQVKKLKIE